MPIIINEASVRNDLALGRRQYTCRNQKGRDRAVRFDGVGRELSLIFQDGGADTGYENVIPQRKDLRILDEEMPYSPSSTVFDAQKNKSRQEKRNRLQKEGR